jgi:hypothetical protein
MTSSELLWPLSVVFGLVLLALLAAIMLWGWLQNRQSSQQQSLLTNLFLQQQEANRTQQEAMREWMSSVLQQNSSQLSASQERAQQYLREQTQQVMTTLATTVNLATSSLGSTATELSELVGASQTLIAARDSITYQAIRGAEHGFTDEGGMEPYTSTEELAFADAERARAVREADRVMEHIRGLTGVKNDEPYPAAGTAFGDLGRPAPAAS